MIKLLDQIMKKIILLALIVVSIILNGCISTIESFQLPRQSQNTIDYGFENFNLLAERIAGNKRYEILLSPETNALGNTQMHLRLFDELNNSMDVVLDYQVIDRISPSIEFATTPPLRLPVGSTYTYPSILFMDNVDGERVIEFSEIIANGYSSGQLDMFKLDSYEIVIRVPDNSGNQSNTLRLPIEVIDTIKPTISGEKSLIIPNGLPIVEWNIEVSDNYDDLDLSNVVVDWRDLNPENPQPGNYIVIFKVSDSSNNESIFERSYEVLFDVQSLDLNLQTLVNRGDYETVFRLIDQYSESFDEKEINDLTSKYNNIIGQRVLNTYNTSKDNWDFSTKIYFLNLNRAYLPNPFLSSEGEQIVLNELNRLLELNSYENALQHLEDNQSYITNSTFVSKVGSVFSTMANNTTIDNEPYHRSLLDRYAYVLIPEDKLNTVFKTNQDYSTLYIFYENNKSTIPDSYRVVNFTSNGFDIPNYEDPIGSNDLVVVRDRNSIDALIDIQFYFSNQLFKYSESMVINAYRSQPLNRRNLEFLELKAQRFQVSRATATPLVTDAIRQQMAMTYSVEIDEEDNRIRVYNFNELLSFIEVPYNHDRDDSLRAYAASLVSGQ
jgi:hypothetical protein